MILMANAMMGAAGYQSHASGSDWWLADGVIDAADCIAAFDPRSAATLTDSYVNLITPGTLDMLTTDLAEPSLDANGWFFDATLDQGLTFARAMSDEVSVVFRYSAIFPPINDAMYVFGRRNGFHNRFFYYDAAYQHTTYGWVGTEFGLGGNRRIFSGDFTQSATVVMTSSPSTDTTAGYALGLKETSNSRSDSPFFYVGHVNGRNMTTDQRGLNGHISHFAAYGVALTEAQALALTSVVDAL